jgi:hypothetical protein
MWLLYADETNLEERSGDFFTYAGLAVDADKALQLSHDIDDFRTTSNVPKEHKLKFNPGPEGFSHGQFVALKQSMIECTIKHDCRLLANVILHDIAKTPDEARRNGINTISFHFDCFLNRFNTSGLVLIDRFSDKQIDAHLVEKFCIGVTNMPFSKEMRLGNVIGFHYSAIGQSHFTSLIDIILGSLRFSINAFTRNEEKNLPTARKLLALIQPLFHRDQGMNSISEISFSFSPKQIKVPKYFAKYQALKTFLGENGMEIAQSVQTV